LQNNVSLIHHAGRLLALGEGGLPFDISYDDLSTIGVHNYAGKLSSGMTAHPKLDPVTGELLSFSYNFFPPFLTYNRINAQGELVQTESIETKGASMMHDFAVTENHVIFMELPVVFSFDALLSGRGLPVSWSDKAVARLGVMPKTGNNADVQWFNIDPCFIFHTMNAYEQGDSIILHANRMRKYWAYDDPTDYPMNLWRYEMDLTTGAIKQTQLDDINADFPQLNRNLLGRNYRYGYGILFRSVMNERDELQGISMVKFDHHRDTREMYTPPPWIVLGESIFVPTANSQAEDQGYLLNYIYNAKTEKSDLWVFNAQAISQGPIAQVKFPFRIPYGFHCEWAPTA
jgi:carotenoid cleavage dioxygenase-like enzyme